MELRGGHALSAARAFERLRIMPLLGLQPSHFDKLLDFAFIGEAARVLEIDVFRQGCGPLGYPRINASSLDRRHDEREAVAPRPAARRRGSRQETGSGAPGGHGMRVREPTNGQNRGAPIASMAARDEAKAAFRAMWERRL
jgi:hypothetical protein